MDLCLLQQVASFIIELSNFWL